MATPDTKTWDEAQGAYDAVKNYQQMPLDARRAIDALGNLLAVRDGYGENV